MDEQNVNVKKEELTEVQDKDNSLRVLNELFVITLNKVKELMKSEDDMDLIYLLVLISMSIGGIRIKNSLKKH